MSAHIVQVRKDACSSASIPSLLAYPLQSLGLRTSVWKCLAPSEGLIPEERLSNQFQTETKEDVTSSKHLAVSALAQSGLEAYHHTATRTIHGRLKLKTQSPKRRDLSD